ncbi:MAG: M14 family metallopeptidase [Rikenellaceae bacterium]
MRKEIILSLESPFRDTFRVHGYYFGEGEKTIAIVGSMRGDEIQQQYICSQLVKQLTKLEAKGKLIKGHQILVIPSVNPFSMNLEKRFWGMDNTDINRMFPGYDQGETTQRIAAGLFEAIKGYKYGIQLASFYKPGDFIPHVRLLETGYEDLEVAGLFGLPYICLKTPLPFDTAVLNYNWQIWETKAFSLYAGQNNSVADEASVQMVEAILRFMQRTHTIKQSQHTKQPDYNSMIVKDNEISFIKAPTAGIFVKHKSAGAEVLAGDVLADIIDPYEGTVLAKIESPSDGIVFFTHNKPLVLQNTHIFKIITDDDDDDE